MSQFERRVKKLEQRESGVRVEVCPYWVGDLSPAHQRWKEDAVRRGVIVILQEAADL